MEITPPDLHRCQNHIYAKFLWFWRSKNFRRCENMPIRVVILPTTGCAVSLCPKCHELLVKTGKLKGALSSPIGMFLNADGTKRINRGNELDYNETRFTLGLDHDAYHDPFSDLNSMSFGSSGFWRGGR